MNAERGRKRMIIMVWMEAKPSHRHNIMLQSRAWRGIRYYHNTAMIPLSRSLAWPLIYHPERIVIESIAHDGVVVWFCFPCR